MGDRGYVVVAVETAHIQGYIFASNRLRENVGASYLVAAATGDWAREIVRDMAVRSNVNADLSPRAAQIEAGEVDVEVLYSGGGNIVLLFAETLEVMAAVQENYLPEQALSRQFIRQLSRRVQRAAPGLRLTFSALPFTWEQSLSSTVSQTLQKMKQARSQQPPLRGDAGLGVQMMDVSTGFPAIMLDKETRDTRDTEDDRQNPWQPYSAETVAKREAAEVANRLLRDTLQLERTDYRFANDLDYLGRSEGHTSYIAVVHADGNGLGQMIQGLQEQFPAGKNREYIKHMRRFSEGVKAVAQAAQRAMIEQIINSVEPEDKVILPEFGRKTEVIELKQGKDDDRYILPLRPLVSGGDDVTFVCDGRIGLDLAVTFLEAFERESIKQLEQRLTACAGIAIVKTHYPFARAYELADELAGSAKQARHWLQTRHWFDGKLAPSALDWHVTAGGLYGDLEEIRQREYCVADGNLTLRPLFLGDFDPEHPLHRRSWYMVRRILTEFQTGWQDHHNKAEGLREVLRKGAAETAVYRLRYLSDSRSPRLPAFGGFEQEGWQDRYCGYYDALELMDKYIALTTAAQEETTA